MSKYTYTPTVILDIDGVLLETTGNIDEQVDRNNSPTALPGVVDKLKEWDRMGCTVILLTGRPESARETTKRQLEEAHIFYDQLVMGVGGGVRILVNDRKPPNDKYPEGRITAFAISPPRNHGIADVDIEKIEEVQQSSVFNTNS